MNGCKPWHGVLLSYSKEKRNLIRAVITKGMSSNFCVGVLMVILKHFFNIEREITQQMLIMANVRMNDCKELVHNLYQIMLINRLTNI